MPVSVGQDMIVRLSSVFNANFTNVTEDKITPLTIRAAERAVDDTMGLTGVIASFAIEILSDAETAETYVSGTNRLLAQPEYQDTRQGARSYELHFGRGTREKPALGLRAGR